MFTHSLQSVLQLLSLSLSQALLQRTQIEGIGLLKFGNLQENIYKSTDLFRKGHIHIHMVIYSILAPEMRSS